MPTSRPNCISLACEWMRQNANNINSVLDIGIGHGKWGFLAREYIYGWKSNQSIDEYLNYYKNFTVDGVEIFEKIITPLQRAIYNEIFIDDILNINIKKYDLAILGDIIEHFTKDKGIEVFKKVLSKCKYVLIMTPNYFVKGEPVFGNENEKHKCVWNKEDFIIDGLYPIILKDIGGQWLSIYEAK